MEMEEERRARLENDAATKRLRFGKKSKTGEDGSYQTPQVGHGDGRKKKSKTGEDGSYHSAQVGPGDRGRKKGGKKDCDCDWSFQKKRISRNEPLAL